MVLRIPPSARLGFGLVKDQYGLEGPEHEDIFTALYEPEPEFVPDPPDTAWSSVMKSLMESASYQQFHETTVLDHELSGVAVKPILGEVEELKRRYEQLERLERESQQLLDPRLHQQLEAQRLLFHGQSIAVVARAVEAAREAVDTVNRLRMMGYGRGAGQSVQLAISEGTLQRMAALVKRVADIYGRFRERLYSTHVAPHRPLVRGVTLGDDLTRVLPSQLVWLVENEDLFLQRWSEHRLLIRDTFRRRDEERGDVVVCVDESGSMSGEKVETAKAYALALRTYLKHQGRRCHIISFSDRAEDMVELLDDDAQRLVDWLGRFIGGGTDFMPPLRKAMGLVDHKTDILIITDGVAPLDDEFKREFLDWKGRCGARLFMVNLEARCQLEELADQVLRVDDIRAMLSQLI